MIINLYFLSMEIINQTEQELLLKTPINEVNKIKKIGGFITFFSVILIAVSTYKSGMNQLKCDKIQITLFSCQLTRTKLMGLYTSENIKISGINEVKTENDQVFLIANNQQIYWSNFKYDEVRLKQWLNNTNNNQLIIKNGNIFAQVMLIIILIAFLIAGLKMLTNQGESLVFRKDIKRFTYTYKNLGFTQNFESPFQDIKKIEHKFVSSIDGSKYYVVNLVLHTRNFLNLSQCIVLYSNPNEQESLAIANHLKDFLNLH